MDLRCGRSFNQASVSSHAEKAVVSGQPLNRLYCLLPLPQMKRGSGHSQYARLSRRLNITGRGWSYFLMVNDLSKAECLDGLEAYKACCADGGACVCTEEGDWEEEQENREISEGQ
jgi:hypothetical protein